MQLQTDWVPSDTEMRRLKDVLKSGLHDGLHEDEIEDIRLHGKIVGRASVHDGGAIAGPFGQSTGEVRDDGIEDFKWQGQIVGRASVRDIAGARAERPQVEALLQGRRSRVPAAKIADEWFNQNYPKLKPEDLADHYRKNVLVPLLPVAAGTPKSFVTYRDVIKSHVVNSNAMYADDLPAAPVAETVENAPEVPSLVVSADILEMHRGHAAGRSDGHFGRLMIIALMAVFALVSGGAAGLLLASPEKVQTLLMAKAALLESFANGPLSLRQ